MSITVTHPERYDGYVWTEYGGKENVAGCPGPAEKWEMVGVSYDDSSRPYLWGRLKPALWERGRDLSEESQTCPTCREVAKRLADAEGERDALRAEVEYLAVKAKAYGDMVHGCSPALKAAGFPVGSSHPDGAIGGVARSVKALSEREKGLRGLLKQIRKGARNIVLRTCDEHPAAVYSWVMGTGDDIDAALAGEEE